MARLVVTNVEEAVVHSLRERALAAGASPEDQHRDILRAALLGSGEAAAANARASDRARAFRELLTAMPDVGTDEDFAIPRDRPRRVRL